MFEWLWDRIGQAVIAKLEEWLQEPRNIEELTKMVDTLFDRELKRMIGSLGGAQKSGAEQSSEMGGIDLQNLLTGRGGLSSKKLIGLGLNWLINKQKGNQDSKHSSLP